MLGESTFAGTQRYDNCGNERERQIKMDDKKLVLTSNQYELKC